MTARHASLAMSVRRVLPTGCSLWTLQELERGFAEVLIEELTNSRLIYRNNILYLDGFLYIVGLIVVITRICLAVFSQGSFPASPDSERKRRG